MKEMIKARKAELEARGTKGFTLMEMLIVVAIIAVLVAIAIPVFTAQLNNARVQADAANIRSGYALVTATAMMDTTAPATGDKYGLNNDGTISGKNAAATTPFTTQGATTTAENIAGQSVTWSAGQTPTYTYAASGATGQGTFTIALA